VASDRARKRLAIPERFEIAEALRLGRIGRDPDAEKKQEPESLRKSLEEWRLSVAMNCQISSMSVIAFGWSKNPLINGGDLCLCREAAERLPRPRQPWSGRL